MEGKEQGKERIRVVFFGGFYRGFYCLDELLHGRIKDKVKVVGVVTSFEQGLVLGHYLPREINSLTWAEINHVLARLLQDHYGWKGVREKLLRRMLAGLFSVLPVWGKQNFLNTLFKIVPDSFFNYQYTAERIWKVWKYGTERRGLVEGLARAHGIEVFKGKVKTPEFYAKFREWDPEVGVMATFGQLLNEEILGYPRLGFYNLHPSDLPAYRGRDPFGDMIKAGEEYTKVTMHKVDAGFDTGDIVAKSDWIRIPPNATPVDMIKITSVSGARLMATALEDILEGKAILTPQLKNSP